MDFIQAAAQKLKKLGICPFLRIFAENCFLAVTISPKQVLTSTNQLFYPHFFNHGFHSNMVLCVRGQVSDQTGMGPKSKPNVDIFWAQKGPKYPPIVMPAPAPAQLG